MCSAFTSGSPNSGCLAAAVAIGAIAVGTATFFVGPPAGAAGLTAGAWYLLDKHNQSFREKFSRPTLNGVNSLWESFKESRPAQITAAAGVLAVAVSFASYYY